MDCGLLERRRERDVLAVSLGRPVLHEVDHLGAVPRPAVGFVDDQVEQPRAAPVVEQRLHFDASDRHHVAIHEPPEQPVVVVGRPLQDRVGVTVAPELAENRHGRAAVGLAREFACRRHTGRAGWSRKKRGERGSGVGRSALRVAVAAVVAAVVGLNLERVAGSLVDCDGPSDVHLGLVQGDGVRI